MFGRSILSEFQEDDFFRFPKSHMRMMDFGFSSPRVSSRERQRAQSCERTNRKNDLVSFGLNEDFFGFNDIFNNMRKMMADMNHSLHNNKIDPSGYHYSQSTFKTYSKIGNSAPRTYEASTSTCTAPGGVKQTMKAVRDSDDGIDKMAVGRHINDRSHVEERCRNAKTGFEERNSQYVNMDESEAPSFYKEWQQRTMKTGLDRPWCNPIVNRNVNRRMVTDGLHRRNYRT